MKYLDTRTVLFDLDGTLVDSAPDLAASVNHALQRFNRDPIELDQLRSFIGNGADRLVHRAITQQLDGVAEENIYDEVRTEFLEHYAQGVCQESRLYPEVRVTLDSLADNDVRLGCVTNKPSRFTGPLLSALKINQYFDVILSGDSLERKKPFPDQLLHAASKCETPVESCVMVGDTHTDISAAQNCQMRSIFVTYGYGVETDLDSQFAGPRINSMNELTAHL